MARVYRNRKMLTAEGKPAYCIDYEGLDGRRRRERTDAGTKEEALALLRRRLSEQIEAKSRGLDSVQQLKPVTFADFVTAEYLPYVKTTTRPGTHERYESLAVHLAGYFGRMTLRQIGPADVEKYITKRKTTEGKAPSPAQINRERAVLGSALNMALRRELIDRNPVAMVRPLREDNARDRWLTEEEQALILAKCSDWLRPVAIVAVNTGLRAGEVLALKRADLVQGNGQRLAKVERTTAKSHKARHVPLNSAAEAAIASLGRFVGEKGPSPFVFVNTATGEPFLVSSVTHAFAAAVRAANFEGVCFHTLRHTFASRCIQAGVSELQVQAWLGHADAHMTARYAHLTPAREQAAGSLEVLVSGTNGTPAANQVALSGSAV